MIQSPDSGLPVPWSPTLAHLSLVDMPANESLLRSDHSLPGTGQSSVDNAEFIICARVSIFLHIHKEPATTVSGLSTLS